MFQGSVSGPDCPGSTRLQDIRGSPSSASKAWAMGFEGTRSPMVRRLGCISRLGTSRVAGKMKVKGGGMGLQRAKYRVIYPGIGGQHGKIGADQGEVGRSMSLMRTIRSKPSLFSKRQARA